MKRPLESGRYLYRARDCWWSSVIRPEEKPTRPFLKVISRLATLSRLACRRLGRTPGRFQKESMRRRKTIYHRPSGPRGLRPLGHPSPRRSWRMNGKKRSKWPTENASRRKREQRSRQKHRIMLYKTQNPHRHDIRED